MTEHATRIPSSRSIKQLLPIVDTRVAGDGTRILTPIKHHLASRLGYSSVAGGWSEEVLVERWTLPPVDHPEVVLKRHRLVTFLHPTPVRGLSIVDGRRAESILHAGNISVLPQEAVVQSCWDSTLELALLEFSPRLLDRLLDGRRPAASEQLVPRTNVQDPIASNLTLAILAELSRPTERLYGELLCLALAVHLLREYGRTDVGAARFNGRLSTGQARRVLDYMHTHLDSHLSVSELAHVAGLSDAYFARAFRATFNESPHQLVLRWRLQRAARLVRNDGFSLAEAAIAAGFCDQAHFTNAMRKHFGNSPGSLLRH
ncbi:MAG TPA: AraC family transcriptional regulator [Gemmataceae bacterium]|nr:AraC family transcriptional regulator [Gemmataceae bacterium]